MTQSTIQPTKKRFTFRTFVLLLIPIILLAGVIALFLYTGGGLRLDSPAPVENLNVEKYILIYSNTKLDNSTAWTRPDSRQLRLDPRGSIWHHDLY